ncbi:hypothetical protein G9A89_009783 [Geosiphon pyriformis]|nr:hypothetical protein G9A89_009783 [Geosiphon pyriformis]
MKKQGNKPSIAINSPDSGLPRVAPGDPNPITKRRLIMGDENFPSIIELQMFAQFASLGNCLRARKDRFDTGLYDNPGITRVRLTGFNIGGVLAIFTALLIKQFQSDTRIPSTLDLKVYTYGAPRFGNWEFAQYVNNELNNPSALTGSTNMVFRVTLSDDYIPQTPSDELGYFHHIKEYWIDDDCNCASSVVREEEGEGNQVIDFPPIYECLGVLNQQSERITEPQDCNKWRQQQTGSLKQRMGPYLGFDMRKCPAVKPDFW